MLYYYLKQGSILKYSKHSLIQTLTYHKRGSMRPNNGAKEIKQRINCSYFKECYFHLFHVDFIILFHVHEIPH